MRSRLIKWVSVHYHGLFVAFHENQISVARQERDWIAVEHAMDRRDHHVKALVRLAIGQRRYSGDDAA